LKSVPVDHSPDAARAELEAALPQLLGDDFHRGVGIEEAMANDLTDDLVGSG
jgi:hypothetical protein